MSACLNHKLPGLQGVYNTHDYFAERKAALETWTALLLEIERGERKVVPMRSRIQRRPHLYDNSGLMLMLASFRFAALSHSTLCL